MKKFNFFVIPFFAMSMLFITYSCDDDATVTEICNNGIDDDNDGDIDCADGSCANESSCIPEICDNGIDDDGDGKIDCLDEECSAATNCQPEICDNGIDDDGDGKIDCLDEDCAAFIGCVDDCNNAIDDDNDGDIDCFDDDCSTFSEPIFTAEWVGKYVVANGLLPFDEYDTLVITTGVSGTDNTVSITSNRLYLTANATITSCGVINLENGIIIPFIPVGETQEDTIFNVHLGDNSTILIDEDIQTIFLNFQDIVIEDGTFDIPLFPYPISDVEIESDIDGSARQ